MRTVREPLSNSLEPGSSPNANFANQFYHCVDDPGFHAFAPPFRRMAVFVEKWAPFVAALQVDALRRDIGHEGISVA